MYKKNGKCRLIQRSIMLMLMILLEINVSFAQKIEHPEWGFKDFPADSVFYVRELSQIAVQTAIFKAYAAKGGTVYLPPGIIKVTNNIMMMSNVKLKGALNKDGSRATTLSASKYLFEGVIMARTGTNNTTVENLIINGNGIDGHGIAYVYGPTNFLIANCEIKNIGYTKIDTSIEALKTLADNPSAILIWSDKNPAKNFTIKNNVAKNYCRHGVAIHNGQYFIIENNYFENGSMGYDTGGFALHGEILGNEVVDCIFGAKIAGYDSEGIKDIIVHNNNHHNLDETPYYDPGYGDNGWSTDSGTALVIQGNGKGVVVKNNILSGVTVEKSIAFWGKAKKDAIIESNESMPSPPFKKAKVK